MVWVQDRAVHYTGRTEVNAAEVGFLVTVFWGNQSRGVVLMVPALVWG